MIFLVNDHGLIIGYQSFPEVTDQPHIKEFDSGRIEKLKECIGLVSLDENGLLPDSFLDVAMLGKANLDLEAILKQKKLALIVESDAKANDIVWDVPEVERDTWSSQESEARSWLLDNQTTTPVLDSICLHRECEKDWLVSRVIDKADLYRSKAAEITAKKQRIEDQLKAAYALKDNWTNSDNQLAEVRNAIVSLQAVDTTINLAI